MTQYGSAVTNPSLLAELEGNPQQAAPQGSSSPNYGDAVSDPHLLMQLNNQGAPHPNDRLNSLWDKLNEQMQPQKQENTVTNDLRKIAGYGTMLAAPEIKIASMLPSGIRSLLPEVSGGLKIGRDLLSSVGKTAAAGFTGTKILPDTTNKQAEENAALGGGLAALTTPLMMAMGSTNPFIRYLTGGALGALGGYGASQLTGHPAITSAIGAGTGALLGGRSVAPAEMAARNAQEAMIPANTANAAQRIPAANAEGIPLNMAEATGSPIHAQMMNNAAMSDSGSKVIYPWALARQQAEEKAIADTSTKISPNYPSTGNGALPFSSAQTMEPAAYQYAFDKARQANTKVDVKPVLDYIDRALPNYEEGSKIALALRTAKSALSLTPKTALQYQAALQPARDAQLKIQNNMNKINSEISDMQANRPKAYFVRDQTGYDAKLQDLKTDLKTHQGMMDQLGSATQNFIKSNKISNYENTVEGLHNAKKGIQGIIESQGDTAVGNTAAGELKQVNKRLNAQLTSASPEYASANNISNMRQAREEIDKTMAKTDLTGKDFYNRVLKNPQEYKMLYDRLANPTNPKVATQAQTALSNLRTAMPDLMDNLAMVSGKALAKEHPNSNFKLLDLAKTFANKVFMNRYNKAVAELMTNPRWQDELAKVTKMKEGEDRGISLGRLISKVNVAGNAAYGNQQGSDQYGGQSR
jgi:hypothetical protein